jgi:hypothetical protein
MMQDNTPLLSNDEISCILEFLPVRDYKQCLFINKDWYSVLESQDAWLYKFNTLLREQYLYMFDNSELSQLLSQSKSKLKDVVLSKWNTLELKHPNKTRNASCVQLDSKYMKELTNQFKKGVTIQMWFKSTDKHGGILFGVQSDVFPSGKAFVPMIYITTNGELRAGFWDKTKGGSEFIQTLVDNTKMNHVSLVGTSDRFQVYLNGNLLGESYCNIDHISHKLYNGQIGSGLCDRWLNTRMNFMFNCYTFVGLISDVQIWNVALTHEEVRASMIDPTLIPDYQSKIKSQLLFLNTTDPTVSIGETNQFTFKGSRSIQLLDGN